MKDNFKSRQSKLGVSVRPLGFPTQRCTGIGILGLSILCIDFLASALPRDLEIDIRPSKSTHPFGVCLIHLQCIAMHTNHM